MSKEKVMTSAAYARRGGTVCPACGSDNISGGEIEIDESVAWQHVGCDACDATWTDLYKLVGYENLVGDSSR